MSKEQEISAASVRLGSTYLPPDLIAELKLYAAGGYDRPKSSLNATIVFLLWEGLYRRQDLMERDGLTKPSEA